QFLELEQLTAHVVGGVVVVVQVNFDSAETLAAQFGQAVQVFGLVFLDGEEERMSRRPAVTVAETAKLTRIFFHPMFGAAPAAARAGAFRLRLEMVGDAKKHMDIPARRRALTLRHLQQIRTQPAMSTALAKQIAQAQDTDAE